MKKTLKISFFILLSLFIISLVLSVNINALGNNSTKIPYSSYYPYNIRDNFVKEYNFNENNDSNDSQPDTLFQRANKPLKIPTYDGSDQLTHPSVLYFPEKWNNHKYWAAATPFPNADDRYENPSIYCFDTPGENWKVPANLTNPVVSQPSKGFNADPCLAYNRTSNELYCLYRNYNYTDLSFKYYLIKSSDGTSWSNPILLYNITSNKPILCSHMPLLTSIYTKAYIKIYNIIHYNIITHKRKLEGGTNNENSNSIVQLPNGTWMMWSQKWDSAYSIVYRTSTDCAHWSKPKDCNFIDSFCDKTVWHIDVKYIPARKSFLMVQYSYEKKYLTLAESRDGIEWKYYSNIILNPDNRNTTNFANSHLYKSSLTYDPLAGIINLWYTGVNTKGEWKIGYTNISYSRLQNFFHESSIK